MSRPNGPTFLDMKFIVVYSGIGMDTCFWVHIAICFWPMLKYSLATCVAFATHGVPVAGGFWVVQIWPFLEDLATCQVCRPPKFKEGPQGRSRTSFEQAINDIFVVHLHQKSSPATRSSYLRPDVPSSPELPQPQPIRYEIDVGMMQIPTVDVPMFLRLEPSPMYKAALAVPWQKSGGEIKTCGSLLLWFLVKVLHFCWFSLFSLGEFLMMDGTHTRPYLRTSPAFFSMDL